MEKKAPFISEKVMFVGYLLALIMAVGYSLTGSKLAQIGLVWVALSALSLGIARFMYRRNLHTRVWIGGYLTLRLQALLAITAAAWQQLASDAGSIVEVTYIQWLPISIVFTIHLWFWEENAYSQLWSWIRWQFIKRRKN